MNIYNHCFVFNVYILDLLYCISFVNSLPCNQMCFSIWMCDRSGTFFKDADVFGMWQLSEIMCQFGPLRDWTLT